MLFYSWVESQKTQGNSVTSSDNQSRTIYPVIMAGGSGTRLWPLSRRNMPKQYCAVTGDRSMLELTLRRVGSRDGFSVAAPIIVCAEQHAGAVRGIADEAGIELGDIILEPAGRNTAPVAAIVAAHVAATDPDGLILLLPADHLIADTDGFWGAIGKAVGAAADGYLITLGIKPEHPETGYGYIEIGESLDGDCYKVSRFVEKPDLETAQTYLDAGTFFWNAGIFLFSAQTMKEEMEAHAADILSASVTALDKADRKDGLVYLDKQSFEACPSDSIDYAIMEKTARAAIVAPVSVGWNDIGAWSALLEIDEEIAGNEVGDVIAVDCKNSYLRSEGPLVAAIGLEDIVVVATGDAVLVARADQAQKVKKIVEALKQGDRQNLL